jgi:hypothetical protein
VEENLEIFLQAAEALAAAADSADLAADLLAVVELAVVGKILK